MYLAAVLRKGWGKERGEGNPMWLWVKGRDSLRDRWTQTRRKQTDSRGVGYGQGRQWNKALCMICLANSSHLVGNQAQTLPPTGSPFQTGEENNGLLF